MHEIRDEKQNTKAYEQAGEQESCNERGGVQESGNERRDEHRHPHERGNAPLSVRGLTVQYSGGATALKDVTVEIKAGEKIALIGPNGAGKTTLFLAIVGVLKPDKGSILVGDVPVDKENILTVRRRAGLVFQNPDDQLFMPTIFDDVAFGPRNFGHTEDEVREKVESVLDMLGITHLRDRSSLKLSGGEKRICAIATVLVMQPYIMLFDEPTAFLDIKSKAGLMEILAGLTQTRIIATHDPLLTLAVSDRVIALEDGFVTDDGPSEEVLKRQKYL